MLRILKECEQVTEMISRHEILQTVDFDERFIWLKFDEIAYLENDGTLTFESELTFTLQELDIVLRFLKVCQTYLTLNSEIVRNLQNGKAVRDVT